jgi:hypothetical protein
MSYVHGRPSDVWDVYQPHHVARASQCQVFDSSSNRKARAEISELHEMAQVLNEQVHATWDQMRGPRVQCV